jgi:hypothetical protein
MTKNMKVNVTWEEVNAYKKTHLKVQPMKDGFGWELRMTDNQTDAMAKEYMKCIEDGKKYEHILHEVIFEKMKSLPLKTAQFEPEMLADQPDVIRAMAVELIKVMGLDKIKTKQQKLKGLPMPDEKKDKKDE